MHDLPVISQSKSLLRVGAPLALASLAQTLAGTIAVAVAGHVGWRELCAVGLGASIFFTVAAFGAGVLLGIEPIASRAAGRGDVDGVRRALGQGLLLAAGLALVLGLALFAVSTGVRHAGVAPEPADDLKLYLWGRLPGLTPYLAFVVLRSAAAAENRTRSVLAAALAANLCVLATAPPLASVLGVLGVGLAESAGAVVQTLVLASLVPRPRFAGSLSLEALMPLLRVGVPVGLALVAEYAVFAGLGLVVAVIEPDALGAHQVAMTWVGTLFMLPVGFGSGVAAQIGRALGRGDAAGARRVAGLSSGLALALGTLLAAPFVLVPGNLAAWVTVDASALAGASSLMSLAAAVLIVDSVQVVLVGAVRGAGDTRFALLASLLGHYAVGLPLGIALATRGGLGVAGLWIGLGAGLTTIAVLLALRLSRHREFESDPCLSRSRESSSFAPWRAPPYSPHRRAFPASPPLRP